MKFEGKAKAKVLWSTIFWVICFPLLRADKLIEVFRWNQIDFHNRGELAEAAADSIVFPGQVSGTPSAQRNDSASYIAYNNVPMGVLHHNGRLFVTVPRRRVGIPSTLNYIDLKMEEGVNISPKLHAYPDFQKNYLSPNHEPNPSRIISVYRTFADECNRLWFIDTGVLEYPGNRNQIQQPSIWIIDLSTDEVLHRFEIPAHIVETGRGLASITIDVKADQCDRAFAYIPDLVNAALYVYNLKNNHIWAFTHNFFHMDPLQGDLTIGGQSFTWDDGIFSATMGPRQSDGFRTIYFHPMVSTNEFIVSSRVLQNEENAQRSYHGRDFMLLGNRGEMRHSTMHQYDLNTDIIFYAEIVRNGVGCWNTKKPFSVENHGTVDSDDQRMIYPSDLTIDNKGVLWVMTNSMPIFIYSSLDSRLPNFRVWKQNTRIAAQNTACALNNFGNKPYN